MTDKQVDGGSVEGTVTDANGNASENQSVQQPSLDAVKLQERLDALVSGFSTLESRINGLQSVKDKDKKEISSLKSKIAEYEQLKERFGADGAVEQIELRDTLSEMKDQLSKLTGSVSTPSGGNGQGGAVDAAKVFDEMGLDRKDPLVNTVLAGLQGKDKDAIELAGYRLQRQIQSSPSPTQAQGASIQGKPAAPENVEALTEEYKQKMQAARGNRSEIQRLRSAYKEKGVDIYAQDFS